MPVRSERRRTSNCRIEPGSLLVTPFMLRYPTTFGQPVHAAPIIVAMWRTSLPLNVRRIWAVVVEAWWPNSVYGGLVFEIACTFWLLLTCVEGLRWSANTKPWTRLSLRKTSWGPSSAETDLNWPLLERKDWYNLDEQWRWKGQLTPEITRICAEH